MKLMGAFLIKLCSAHDFSSYFHKMATGGHFGFSDYLQKSIGFVHSRSSMAVSNLNLIRALVVSQLRETKALACGVRRAAAVCGYGGGCGCGVQTKTTIYPKCKFRRYNYNLFRTCYPFIYAFHVWESINIGIFSDIRGGSRGQPREA